MDGDTIPSGWRPDVTDHTRAVLEALLVTVLWSSSYVLIAVGLERIPALTFAGLRYGLATLVLLGPFLARGHHRTLRASERRTWARIAMLGVLLYAVTQGAQFVALQYLKSASVSLVLTFTPAVVAVLGIPLLDERASRSQWIGMAVMFAGVGVYFWPLALPFERALGVGVMVLGLLGNALAALLGRAVNRDRTLPPLAVTTASMAIGSALLLGTGVATQPLPTLDPVHWLIVGWLAVVNTAGAFTLWNRTLQRLSAVESSVINNTMLVQVAAFGWVFLGETLTAIDLSGMALVGVGALVVQVRGR